ncbi:calcium/sodium antiporter [Tessaracoccus sp. MC1679]|uniref:calcium/sodium antiporter n=1 Tax=Tessaracoccus sp. MC1679 TaxID=2760313 RepID=UPI00160415D7|nr:calcium/sodium antiporter [Tessaracoccus sp. MC1679]
MLTDVLLILGGLVLLVLGGELMVRGAGSLARRLGMSPLVVGLTVVSVATSAPELAVTVDSVLAGAPELAVGNVIGSNTGNVLLILGVGALMAALSVQRQLLRFDLPAMVGLSFVLLLLSLDGSLGLIDGVILMAAFVTIMVTTVILGRRAVAREAASGGDDAEVEAPSPVWVSVAFVAVGVAALVFGAQLLVRGAVSIAFGLGVSELIIGLTIVALGTSLPELAATVAAVRRGEVDIAVGNVVGSNIANIGLILGLPALFSPGGLPVPASSVALDLPLMIAAALALGTVAFTGHRVVRLEGGVFVALYAAYLGYMVLASAEHDALRGFSLVMVAFVLPLLLVVGAVTVWEEVQLRRSRPAPAG